MSITYTNHVPAIAQSAKAPHVTFGALCRDALRLVLFWNERARQRAVLADLDEHMLRDIGLTKYDVKRECEKAFWQ